MCFTSYFTDMKGLLSTVKVGLRRKTEFVKDDTVKTFSSADKRINEKSKSFFCGNNSKRIFAPESWQSGRLRQS